MGQAKALPITPTSAARRIRIMGQAKTLPITPTSVSEEDQDDGPENPYSTTTAISASAGPVSSL